MEHKLKKEKAEAENKEKETKIWKVTMTAKQKLEELIPEYSIADKDIDRLVEECRRSWNDLG